MTAPTPDSTAPEGNGQESQEDQAAQALLAAALEADGETDGDDTTNDDTWDEEAAKKKFAKANREAQNLREQIKTLKPLADEAEKRRKGEMSESQRLTEEKAALEVQLAELTTANARRDAAEAAGLPAKFTKFITAADPTEALEQAKELAKALKGSDDGKRTAPNLGQGARGANNSGSTVNPDDLLRQLARRS